MRAAGFANWQIVLAAALIVPPGLISAYAMSNHPKANAALQELADNAALAGVNSLASSADQPQEARIAASVAAAKNAVVAKTGVLYAISPSIDHMTMSVVMDDRGKGSRVSSTAYYIPPSDELAPWQASAIADRPSAAGIRRSRL